MIFTSLLLLLCQDEPTSISSVKLTPTQSQENAQEAGLVLHHTTWTDYRKAMHLIDVRGQYGRGAAELLQLVDKPDVIMYSGQASWILAQAARALTLAGNSEEAAKYIPGARNGSRGTEFEKSITQLLASFAPQSAGLDPEFLGFVRQQVNAGGENLRREYGRESLPYLRFIVEDSQGTFGLQLQRKAVKVIFGMMDAETGKWLGEELLKLDSLSRRTVLLGMQFRGSVSLTTFMDSDARVAAAKALLHFSASAPEDSNNLALDSIVGFLAMEMASPSVPFEGPLKDKIYARVVEFAEQGHRGVDGTAIRWAVAPTPYRDVLGPTFLMAESSNPAAREDARWALMSRGVGKSTLREYAGQGALMDQLRFCLAISSSLGGFNTSGLSEWDQNRVDWTRTFLTNDGIAGPFFEHQDRLDFQEEDIDVLASMESCSHPFVRYLAVNALLFNGAVEKAIPFFENLGEDPLWAIHTFRNMESNSSIIPASAAEFFESLGNQGQLQNEVRSLVERAGGQILTPELWLRWNLSPSKSVVADMLDRMTSQEDQEDLLGLLLSESMSESMSPAHSNRIAYRIAQQWPLAYLGAIPQLESVGRRQEFLIHEIAAWELGVQAVGSRVVVENEGVFGSFLFVDQDYGGRQKKWLASIAREQPDLMIRLGLARVADREAMVRFFNATYGYHKGFDDLLDRTAATQFAVELVRNNMDDLPRVVNEISQHLIDPSSESAVPFFETQWEMQPLNPVWADFLIRKTVEQPALRERFREELLRELNHKVYSVYVADYSRAAGFAPEILDELLEAIAHKPEGNSLISLLRAISVVDDPRVIDVLLSYVDDPRAPISQRASSGLEQLLKARELKNRLSKWAVDGGEESLSALDALLQNLKDPDLEIRLVSIESLGTLGDKDALPALINLMRDENPQIKEAARKTLDRINKVPVSTTEQVKAQLTVHLVELEGELAALRLKFTDDHMDVAAVLKKIEITKEQLANLENN